MSKKLTVEPEQFSETFEALETELGRIIVGQQEVLRQLCIALFADGHVLLEGVPGLGKTLLAKSMAQACGLSFSRIQCTPDLMPADILGTQLVVEREGRKTFEFSKGPVFTHLLLADEINRATPKTQSALLEAMAEHQISVAGNTMPLDEPFFVIATQNPIEMEGTFTLPEAQLDRFLFRIFVGYPTPEDLTQIMRQTTGGQRLNVNQVIPGPSPQAWILAARELVREVLVAEAVEEHIVKLITVTRPDEALQRSGEADATASAATRLVRYGASPRGAQAILMGAKVRALLEGRVNVSFEDVDYLMLPALNHRLVLSFEAEADRRTSIDVLRELTESVGKNTVGS